MGSKIGLQDINTIILSIKNSSQLLRNPNTAFFHIADAAPKEPKPKKELNPARNRCRDSEET
jgi:hypothetical protein